MTKTVAYVHNPHEHTQAGYFEQLPDVILCPPSARRALKHLLNANDSQRGRQRASW
jgi:hypothetical protein